MATFDQQGQHVNGPQYNAETINIDRIDREILARELAMALSRVQELGLDEPTRQQVSGELEAAGADIQAGRTSLAQERLARVRAMGGALAEVAGAFLRGTGVLGV
ncbi:hypothetical protein Snoj_23060 [Streptomyces nojiriensis]|uniref:Uncharacterized protein n=1 Tax=Streptomyces nojiriensis TaxID=66374 RepID=A0ABQ3SJS7_9ACTN|nr:hypothetical protein [Streptomyces nojiriensis]QTI49991.1 hypothetical protein JYK04_07865 [Streptomyces nojiriensis]GGS22012.1 hypothetical protein GCM10010205_59830 [Streptomyces nojiriensis]GHI68388.1 hypothetical protein Snoj_23060 [Streptomyces nojiriensis]